MRAHSAKSKQYMVDSESASLQLPVVQDLNGDALENDYVVRAGFRFDF